MRRYLLLFTIPLFVVLALSPAQAAELTYTLTGVVTSPDGTYEPDIALGDDVVVIMVVEDSTPDANTGNPNAGFFQGSILSTSITAGLWSADSRGLGFISSVNDTPGTSGLQDEVNTRINLTGPAIITTPRNLAMSLIDPTATALAGDEFPDLTAFPVGRLTGTVSFNVGGPRLEFDITGISVIPEPSTALLMALGLGALASRRRTA